MRAIILAAGQGTRLLPFTRDHPKCLVPVEGRPIIDHQLEALRAAGIGDILIVGGYRIDRLAEHIAELPARLRPALLCNPFWSVANSIGSVWTARQALQQPFCLLNGDTIFAPAVMEAALGSALPGVSLLVERARLFAHDDMRVAAKDGLVRAVGKELRAESGFRSLGVIVAKDGGEQDYGQALDEVICTEGGAQLYHHTVIDHLARRAEVKALVNQSPLWIEIDRPEDIARWHAR